jgi:sugar/nucleoside kinase (ribokinase family)
VSQVSVAVVGRLYVDHIFDGITGIPHLGEEVYASGYHRSIGGGAAIVSCWLARLGKDVGVIGVIGAAERNLFVDAFHKYGVDCRLVRICNDPSGLTCAASLHADRSFLTYCGANERLGTYLLDDRLLHELEQVRHVHFAVPLAEHVARKLLPQLKAAGCTISLHAGYHPEWYASNASRATWPYLDCFFCNEQEAQLLAASNETGARLYDMLFAASRAAGINKCVLKLGGSGAMTETRGERVHVRPPHTTVIETTGAGDAFDAGYVDAWLGGASDRACLQRGCVCGALSIGAPGGSTLASSRSTIEQIEVEAYAQTAASSKRTNPAHSVNAGYS